MAGGVVPLAGAVQFDIGGEAGCESLMIVPLVASA